ncbi:MAG: hypothetical protein ACI9KE_001548 [Polyangiales bacterium]|jgi:hypothetical protein
MLLDMSRLAAFLAVFTPALALAQGGSELAPPPTSAGVAVDVEVEIEVDGADDVQAGADTPVVYAQPHGQAAVQVAPVQPSILPPQPRGAPLAPTGYGPAQQNVYAPGQAYTYPPRRSRHVRIRYREGMEVPEGAALVEHRRRGLLIAGIAAFAASYGISAVFASLDAELAIMAVPFAGPLIWQARDGNSDTAAGMAFLSIAQVVGVVLFALGLRKRTYIEYWAGRDGPTLIVTPDITPQYAGVSLTLF